MDCTTSGSAPGQRTSLELADVVREHAHRLEVTTIEQECVLEAVANCRTPALGGHEQKCDHCGHTGKLYNSCSNRHCPKCQGLNEIRWVENRCKDLLPVEYFHNVFTIPDVLHPIFLRNRRTAYDLLFEAVNETLQEVALNPEHLGARIGFTALLHTWTQQLLYHPHVHCIIAGGGLTSDEAKWVSSKPRYFLPTKVLSKVFRGKLLSKLETGLDKGKLTVLGVEGKELLRKAATKEWVIDSRPPFAGPEQVLRYLGHYAHRIAISNARIVSMDDEHVTFTWKDRANGNLRKLMTIEATEFLRRFLLHILPRNYYRIRHFGFLANTKRRKAIALCRQLLAVTEQETIDENDTPETWQETLLRATCKDFTLCPKCQKGHMLNSKEFQSVPEEWWEFPWNRKPP